MKGPSDVTITPLKSIQPIPSAPALPERVPSLLLSTPPLVGFKFIQPLFSFQAYPVKPESVMRALPLVAPKFTQPISSDQAEPEIVPLLAEAKTALGKKMTKDTKNKKENCIRNFLLKSKNGRIVFSLPLLFI